MKFLDAFFWQHFLVFNEFLIFIHKFKQKKFLGTFILLSRGSGWFLTDINVITLCVDGSKCLQWTWKSFKSPSLLRNMLNSTSTLPPTLPNKIFLHQKVFHGGFPTGWKKQKKQKSSWNIKALLTAQCLHALILKID